MKKTMTIILLATAVLAAASAATLSVGVKGTGTIGDNSGFGTGLDVTYTFDNNWGFEVGSDFILTNIEFLDGGVSFEGRNAIEVPLYLTYTMNFDAIYGTLGLGCGTSIGEEITPYLSAEAKLGYALTDAFSLYAQVRGNLTCVPTIGSSMSGDKKVYKMESPDLSTSSVTAAIGGSYKFAL